MAKASQFTQYGTLDPAQDMIPFLRKTGGVYENAKITPTAAGIGQPDYVARASAGSAQAQANEASDIADTALTTAWTGTSAGAVANSVASNATAIAMAGTNSAREARAVAQTALVTGWAGTAAAREASSVAQTALVTAWMGTDAPTAQAEAAYSVARTSLVTGWAGTSAAREARAVAQTALITAWIGTEAPTAQAEAAYSVARTALTTAWTGTAVANNAVSMATYAIGLTGTASASGGGGADLGTAWAGTAAAREARAVAQTALETSWAGTTLASSAHSVASAAYNVAVSGTVGSVTVAVSSGSAVLDFEGQVYQTVNITGDTVITVTNQKPITPSKVQEITAVLRSDGVAHNVTCDNFNWMTDPVTTIGANKEIFLALTSFGSVVSQVYASALIEDTRFLSMNAQAIQSYNMARTALDTSWAGTATANNAWLTATSGTVGSVTVPVASGTAVLDMSGQAFQTVNVTSDIVLDMVGQLPITPTRVQEITARLVSDGVAHNITCANFDWMTDPVTTIAANQEIFIGFVSFGSNVNQVYATPLIEDTRILSINAQANAAYSLARASYTLAQAGTISHSTTSASAGTVVFSMSGSAYQSVVIGGDTAITVANIQAPSATHIQAITARVHNNNSGSNFNLFWDAFGIIGQAPPATVTNNHSVFASFTSYGTNVQNVFLAASSHV